MALLLAGDVGGTSTRIGLFESGDGRPRAIVAHTFSTLDFDGPTALVAQFLRETGESGARVRAACFGVAGPVVGDTARLSNAPWALDGARLSSDVGLARVRLVNDLVAMASAIDVLDESDLAVLQAGAPAADGNRALIAAGTGLGEALLHLVDGRFVPSPSEAGHADFAARNETEMALVRHLTAQYGRAMVEHVVSGQGMVNLFQFTHARSGRPCAEAIDVDHPDAPEAISAAGTSGRCDACASAVTLFMDAYGAEAGNLALRTVATGGIYIGGGIAPKMLAAIRQGTFLEAFRAKSPFDGLMARIPVHVIVETQAGLLGAAVCAARMLS
jgi:glucokinase